MRFFFIFLIGFVGLTGPGLSDVPESSTQANPTFSSNTTNDKKTQSPHSPCFNDDEGNSYKSSCEPYETPSNLKSTIQLIQKLLKRQLDSSMLYLFIGSQFNAMSASRPGFHRFFMELSDDYWNDAIKLLHHIVLRGNEVKIEEIKANDITKNDYNINNIDEFKALRKALDIEKKTAHDMTHIIHLLNQGNSLTLDNEEHHDVEFAHFLAEELSDKNIVRVKRLSNLVHIYGKLIDDHKSGTRVSTLKLSTHYFDTEIINSKHF